MKKILICLAILGFLATAAYAEEKPAAADAANLLVPLAEDNILGDPKAKVTIIEYASLSCPHCAAFAKEVLPKLDEEYIKPGKVKYIYRHFPLNAPALKAAALTECAPREQYYTYIEVLFDTQKKWAFTLDYVADLQNIAMLGGMTEADFTACMNNKKIEEKVANTRLAAEKNLKVGSTPTIFINGKLVESDHDFPGLKKIIDAEMAATNGK